MNSLCGVTVRKDIEYKHEFNTERWIETEDVDRIEVYHNLEKRGYIVKTKNNEGIDDDETSTIN